MNIGLLIFVVILAYVVISFLIYLTSQRTEVYEVRTGSLSEQMVYEGIAIRSEAVVNSDYTGTINYYNKEGDRVPVGGLVYSVDENGEITDYLEDSGDSMFSAENLQTFRRDAIAFMRDFDPAHFASLYDFKSGAISFAQKISNRKVLSSIENIDSTQIHTCAAESAGEIVYSIDHMEGTSFENLTADSFNKNGYNKKQLDNGSRITAGDPAYKLVTDENWSVAIQVPTEELARNLVSESYLEVKFLKDGNTAWASVSSRSDEDGNYYVNLGFTNSMEAYCSDRYLDVELVTAEQTGLKVPNSAITKGNFFLVPKDFVFEGSSGQQGVLLEIYTENNEKSTQFINAVPYGETEDYYYLDDSVLRAGEIIDRVGTSEQFTLGDQDELIGVYYINKGYPDFRQVNILYQNEEYAIVTSGSLYGLQEYDYIVLHADSIDYDSY